jgi:diguanylate cyclase (GGDEF)-like protein
MRLFPSLAKLQRVTDTTSRRWLIGIVPLGIVALLFSPAVAYYLFDTHLSQQKEQLRLISAKTSSDFDHEMTLRTFSIIAMRKTAEQYLMERNRLTLDPTRYLRRIENPQGYMLDLPPGYGKEELGNITGAGPIPATDSAAAREMAMTIGLLPLFQTVIARDSDTPWVYYTSKNRFTSLYPRVSPEVFFYSDKSLEYDVFTMALPRNNPQRNVFWTPPYRDEAGKGMMVTVAAPVYEGDVFRGSIALDITLSKLAWLLERYEIPHSQVYLYTQDGVYLAGSANDPGFIPAEFAPHAIIERDGNFITDLPLKAVPWRILVVTPQAKMRNSALRYALPFALVVAFLFGSVMLLVTLSRTLRRVEECSIRDGLTGLYNRRHFDACAARELACAKRDGHYFGLMMLDLDYFKLYNDTYGHQAGDTVLKTISQILTDTLKRPADQAFRVGGEEFAILTKAERPEQIEALAQLLHDAIDTGQLFFSASLHAHVTASIGVATLAPTTPMNVDELYAKADQALYSAKEKGRNCVISTRL